MSKKQYLPLDIIAMEQARHFSANACSECVGLTELCPACQDLKDTHDTEMAHQIVDESDDYTTMGHGTKKYPYRKIANGGSVTERNPLSIIRDQPSGHDWTEREGELLEPITLIADRIFDLETSMTLEPYETKCEVCHYTCNKHAKCPNCY